MVRVLILSLLLTGCTLSLDVPKFKSVDVEARQDIAAIKDLIQKLGPILDKSIDEKVTERLKKKK